jgi:hypothetical protein
MSTVSSRSQGSSGKRPIAPRVPPPPPPPQESSAEESEGHDESDNEPMAGNSGPSASAAVQPTQMVVQDDRNKAKINPPEPFKGERGKLKTFLTQASLYIYWNSSEFPNDEKKIMFIISYMRGTAYAWIEDRLAGYLINPDTHTDRLVFTNYSRFLTNITTVFGNVDEKRIAERELKVLKQRTSAADYSAHFQRICAHLNWGEEALTAAYYDGLKDDIKDEIARKEDPPNDLSTMIETSIKIDNRLFERKLQKKGGSFRGHSGQHPQKGKNPDPYGPMPMELGKIQSAPKQFRRSGGQKGKCFNCGKPGHYANKCRSPKKQNEFTERTRGGHLNAVNSGQRFSNTRDNREKRRFDSQQPAHLAMIRAGPSRDRPRTLMRVTEEGLKELTYGPNQVHQNPHAAEDAVRTRPNVLSDSNDRLHHVIPMSWCTAEHCHLWEHSDKLDPGMESWGFAPNHDREITNTQLRQVLKMDKVKSEQTHVHHHHIPRSECDAKGCTYPQHQVPAFDSLYVESEGPGKEVKEPLDLNDASWYPQEFRKASIRLDKFVSEILLASQRAKSGHHIIHPKACIDWKCERHPTGGVQLLRFMEKLDKAIEQVQSDAESEEEDEDSTESEDSEETQVNTEDSENEEDH